MPLRAISTEMLHSPISEMLLSGFANHHLPIKFAPAFGNATACCLEEAQGLEPHTQLFYHQP